MISIRSTCSRASSPGHGHRELHITSEQFDEPRALDLLGQSDIVIGAHERADRMILRQAG
ncbi:poly-gamma-glutamate hydrolase family protein [Daeguia caeni]|uniref:Poly-gamma-glutamate hydrolase family protein n=1 Tax=Daeguia caeni TaxID=439612 RepID=A0ABV9H767_9HYPH